MIATSDVIANLRTRDIENNGNGPLYRRLQSALKAVIDDGILQVEDALQVHDVRGRHVALIEQERDVADPARDQGRRFGRARALGLSLGTCPRCSCAAGRG